VFEETFREKEGISKRGGEFEEKIGTSTNRGNSRRNFEERMGTSTNSRISRS
jgi:hypothetical protein